MSVIIRSVMMIGSRCKGLRVDWEIDHAPPEKMTLTIESVDSISRDGPDMPYIYNTLQIPKYLKIGNFMKFLSAKIRISSKLSI